MALQQIVLPSGFVALLFLIGLAALALRRTRGHAWLPLLGSGLLYLAFSNGLVATLLMSPLEYEFPAMHDPSKHADAHVIVVLTAYAADDGNMPASSRLNSSSAFRVLEAANLFARRPDCRVMVTGSQPAALIMAQQLAILGVPTEKLIVDGESPDTVSSAARIGTLFNGERVFLVTSAAHMTRSVSLFRRQGTHPVPAPTDYWLPQRAENANWGQSALHLRASDLAMHEHLAIMWYRLTGRL